MGLSETSSNSEDSEMEPDESDDTVDSYIERVFLTGSLDELRVCFSSSNQVCQKTCCFQNFPHYMFEKCLLLLPFQHGQNFEKVLLAEERHLIEFRAIGGQVQIVNLTVYLLIYILSMFLRFSSECYICAK